MKNTPKIALISRLVCLPVALMFLLSACASNSRQPESNVRAYPEISFPDSLPVHGNYNIRAIVMQVVQCPKGAKCLVADHLSVARLGSTNAEQRAILIYPQDMLGFERGKRYLFSFVNGEYVGAQRLD